MPLPRSGLPPNASTKGPPRKPIRVRRVPGTRRQPLVLDRWETLPEPAPPSSPRAEPAPAPTAPRRRMDAARRTAVPVGLLVAAAAATACAAATHAVTSGVLASATVVTLPLAVCPPLCIVPLCTATGTHMFFVSALGLAALSACSGAAAVGLPLCAAMTAA